MNTRIALALSTVLAAALAVQQGVALYASTVQPAAGFSIVVNAEGRGISAVCQQGCAWERLTATYPNGGYRITNVGIQPVVARVQPAEHQVDASEFSLVVNTRGKGISAECAKGCAWKVVSAAHPAGAYRITDHGISANR